MDFIHKVQKAVHDVVHDAVQSVESFGHSESAVGTLTTDQNRFGSFAPQTTGQAKWHVDGASYFWAVSEALESAKENILIMDWWLSPELYLRRPPSRNEQYRLDTMLKAAAERGVRVNVIVYKEVEKALTLNSKYSKEALEALHPNIAVFRHPDHLASALDVASTLQTDFKTFSLSNFQLATAPRDALQRIFGTNDDIVLFWAHHEKLIVVDHKLAFMGGLDLCFGRWDTSSHPIADAHPSDLNDIIFPGQDYNNARIYDFANVNDWQQNKLDRTKSSRMGWSDVSFSLQGPILSSLITHFTNRWNFIYDRKYAAKRDVRYSRLELPSSVTPLGSPVVSRAHTLMDSGKDLLQGIQDHFSTSTPPTAGTQPAESHIQLTRSCSEWSSGNKTEHSIANAYIWAIKNAIHFVYIENQFFITATQPKQSPVENTIGAAIVERILRAHNEGKPFTVIVVMPAVPGFAGDLRAKDALGTRAIMEFQYASINRGEKSIMGQLRAAGVTDPSKYIRFYNLRNYDRINVSKVMKAVEDRAGVGYEEARKEHDDIVGAGFPQTGEGTAARVGDTKSYEQYQAAASKVVAVTLDTVSSSYMQSGPKLDSIGWQGDPAHELNAYVCEELYIHTKLLIADDRVVICGSANLNDRSQLGSHDSEIAVVVEDPTSQKSVMGGQPFDASTFATSLRRYIFRKHLGLIPDQLPNEPNINWKPVSGGLNDYDWGSAADLLVQDPLGTSFEQLWAETAATNTQVFSRAFHNVPNDKVRTWDDYQSFFSRHFLVPGSDTSDSEDENKVEYGHVVREEFPGGVAELKAELSRVRGSLVHMPLDFLADVADIAREGLQLNAFTQELFT